MALDLEAIKERLEGISPGPWHDVVTDTGSLIVDLPGYKEGGIYFGDMEDTGRVEHANARFIAHSREDIPALVAEIERLTEELEGLHDADSPVTLARRGEWP